MYHLRQSDTFESTYLQRGTHTISTMKHTLLAGLARQIDGLKTEVDQIASGALRRQESSYGGPWQDCSRAQAHHLNNVIASLEAIAMLLRDPPAGLFSCGKAETD